MGRIDDATVQRILDAADIVDVVSDYVKLRRRGSGFIGLCPFHNERTPSFSVSKTKGICRCFSCGKGGSPVGFIMEVEQMTYPEALRLLARKYNIEIEERELSAEEREAATERESMMAINEFAMQHFERNMLKTTEGQNIGLSYFRERGINDAMIKRFHLGYSMEQRDALYKAAVAAGFKGEYLLKTSLCLQNERGEWRDRFRGRVIFPVFTVSGKVVAFGGRTLRKDKEVAKYVNSSESIIYSKSRELYGLYQAKPEIVRKDKCILVEGYMDVISMHQAGIQNVVASSGTSLTEGQIRLIHRFTENVTVIYDSDPAGIKASLRGIDMLLAEGLMIKVLLLPDGDDPDSFAQSHSASEVEEYIAANEGDFIKFKTRIMLEGTENDPISRSRAINDIVRTISVIPDPMLRTMYIGECSRTLGVSENLLTLQVEKLMAEAAERRAADEQRERLRRQAGIASVDNHPPQAEPQQQRQEAPVVRTEAAKSSPLAPYEREILRYALRYGMLYLGDVVDVDGEVKPFNVIEYIVHEMAEDEICFTSAEFGHVFNEAVRLSRGDWQNDLARFTERQEQQRQQAMADGIERIRQECTDLASIQKAEKVLKERVDAEFDESIDTYTTEYLGRILASSADDTVRTLTVDLVNEKHKLSKIHTKYAHMETERDHLNDLVPMALYNLKAAMIELRICEIQVRIKEVQATSIDEALALMREQKDLEAMKVELARYLGERTISQRRFRR